MTSAQQFFEWLDKQEAAVRPEVKALIKEHGYSFHHTGGGCLAWSVDLTDGFHVLVTCGDNEVDGDPDAEIWHWGVYDDDGGFIEHMKTTRLKDALVTAKHFTLDMDKWQDIANSEAHLPYDDKQWNIDTGRPTETHKI